MFFFVFFFSTSCTPCSRRPILFIQVPLPATTPDTLGGSFSYLSPYLPLYLPRRYLHTYRSRWLYIISWKLRLTAGPGAAFLQKKLLKI